MADGKEAFLSRWSRLKQEQPAEKKAEVAPAPATVPPLPPVDQLTPESDFSGFMNPKVEDALRRVALKKLFSDPHFNIPDPYEAYSGDWTGGEPIPEAMLASLEQMKALLKTPPAETSKKEISQEEKPQPDEPGRQDT
jgi:hypothetical protein